MYSFRKFILTFANILLVSIAFAQPREETFDYSFRPSQTSPFFYVITEKKDSTWHQKAYYISTLKMARECSYKDEKCSILHGDYTFFDIDGFLKQTGTYVSGKKAGTWLGYNEKGQIVDSGEYVNDRLKGIRMKWYSNGMPSDSMNFDGAGNGVHISWYEDGTVASAGYWMQDSLKKGKWQYFYHDGKLKATEDYVDGKIAVCNCYTEKGIAIDTALCREKEAVPAGGTNGWLKFLQKSLRNIVENLAVKGIKSGSYTVMIKFAVLEDGTISEFTSLTKFGHGIEEEVIKAMRSAPKWEPGRLFGKSVKSYHTQPITFVVQD